MIQKKTRVLALMLACLMLIAALPLSVFAAKEERQVVDLSKTDVLADLAEATFDGKAFDVADYPKKDDADVKLLSFTEYCYSAKENDLDFYGLYVYLYNPTAVPIADNANNSVQMATVYGEDGEPTDYEKFGLDLCSHSDDYLFYKFKVILRDIDGVAFEKRLNPDVRRYDVSGIELWTATTYTVKDYHIGGKFVYTGYSAGFGPDGSEENTLKCEVDGFATLELDVHYTYYRSQTSNKGAGYQNQLNTVYFAVPNAYFEEGGYIKRIKAEWYEYLLKDVVVTSNLEAYNAISKYLGVEVSDFIKHTLAGDMNINFDKDIGWYLAEDLENMSVNFHSYYHYTYQSDWSWNGDSSDYSQEICETLYYLFYASQGIDNYDPYGEVTSTGGVTSTKLLTYILEYSKNHPDAPKLKDKDGKDLLIDGVPIVAELFETYIDPDRIQETYRSNIDYGYSYMDFDVDIDTHKWQSWSDTDPSFWDDWQEFGFWAAINDSIPTEEGDEVAPIIAISADDLVGDDDVVADNLYIRAQDVKALREFQKQAEKDGNTVVLFRFALTDYYSAPLTLVDIDAYVLNIDDHIEGQAYRAYGSAFLNFDVIQLGVQSKNGYTVIPVVSEPMNILSDFTSPTMMPDDNEMPAWLMWVVFAILVLVLIVLCPGVVQVVTLAVKLLVWLLSLPFKAVAMLVKSSQKTVKRRKRRYERRKETKK